MPNSNDLKDLESQLKKTVISAESFRRTSSFDTSRNIANIHKTVSGLAGHVRKVVIRVGDLEKRVENNSKKITSLKNISALQGPQIRGTNIGAKLPGGSVQTVDKNIAAITESVSSIAKILAGRKKLAEDTAAYERKKSEREKRALAESKLEKRFDGLKRAAEKILSPVKSILDKIINFLVTVLLGRVVYKLIEWWGNPKNAGKVKSIIRFLTDWGPALLGGFILFGTRFGKGVRILTRIALSGIAKLAKAIPVLLRFARRNPRTALALTAGAYATTQLTERAFSGGDSNTQGFVGGGYVKPKFPVFGGGGFNFKNMMGGSFSNGYVSGEKGVDKIPAMLSDGEFVMSRGAVEKYGVDTLEAMNAAGGGTNKPKVMGGKVYAAGGGPIGGGFSDIKNIKDFIKYKIGYDVDRPSTWGASFQSAFGGSSGSRGGQSGSGVNIGSLTRGVLNQGQGLANQGLGLLSAATDSRSYQGLINRLAPKRPEQQGRPGLLEQAQGFVNNLFTNKKPTQQQQGGSGGNLITSSLGRLLSFVASKPYFGEEALIERERGLGLMKPGADSLTKETRLRLNRNDNWIKSLYDPTKDKGITGEIKKRFQDIQDKGLIPDVTKMLGLKSEGFEKFVEKASGGRIKNFGASLQGVQMSLKALSGPLGRMQRVEDDGAMGRYLRPAMMEAQKRGHGRVGRAGLTGKLYDDLLQNKIANFALGQTSFMVDKTGRAKTGVTGTSADEVWDFNQTAQQNFAQSREALNNLGRILQGQKVTTKDGKPISAGKALYETGFKGLAGIYRILQNTMYGNLRPMGSNIDLGGGFKPTDSRGNVLSSQQIRQANKTRSNVKPVKPPVKPKVTVVRTKADTIGGGGQGGGRSSRPKTPSFSASTRGSSAKANTLGIPNQASYR